MEIADLARLRLPSDPTLTPDGRLAAVVVTRIDLDADAYRSAIWVAPTDGSQPPRRFTHGPRDTRPRFSPDGGWLAFLRAPEEGHPQVHVMPADGGEPRQISEHPLGAAELTWSPDSTRLAYTARVPEERRYGTADDVPPEKEPPRHITSLRYRVDNVGFTIDRPAQIFVVDAVAEGATPTQLTDAQRDHAASAWSPDGGEVAFVAVPEPGHDADWATDVFVVPAGGGQPRRVTPSTLPATDPAFTDDGTSIVFVAPGGLDFAGRTSGLWRVPADGSAPPERLSDAEAHDVDTYAAAYAPLVTADAVMTISLDRGAVALLRFPLDGTAPTPLLDGPRQVTGFAQQSGVLAAVVATDTSAGELVAVRDGVEQQLSHFGEELARAATLRPMEEVTTSAPDGYPVHGWVVKPHGDGPFPVLLAIHGGPFTQYGYTLFDEAQVYAGAGYAVVLGNPRGAAGYGETHGRAIVGDLGDRDADDLLALLDAALDDEHLDAGRVGVMGGSYGGFMSAWLAAHTDRFAAAIVERAVTAWDSFTGSSDIGWLFAADYCGRDPDRQRAQSPLTHADAITIPTLIIHSEQDWRCPLEQAQRLFERLKRNRVETELLVFPGEGHELTRSGLPSHRVARFEAILDWWARWLR
jgi:dipeptidyl aminopeptidase/acylaminoacyl peptidase